MLEMNRADAEREAIKLVDDIARCRGLTREEVLLALCDSEVRDQISRSVKIVRVPANLSKDQEIEGRR